VAPVQGESQLGGNWGNKLDLQLTFGQLRGLLIKVLCEDKRTEIEIINMFPKVIMVLKIIKSVKKCIGKCKSVLYFSHGNIPNT
jgi:hypothetical protein